MRAVPRPACLIVLCTAPDRKAARRIARALLAERLAACVNRVGPIRSTYAWKGKLRDDPEMLLLIKTTRRRYAALERRIVALHPYEVPEVVAFPIRHGWAKYLDWVRESTD